ncbi:hypothetical protein OAC89_01145 [Deltaproteobacteria bacterium]|nr:hypothetical protein [Deltaproteobacteria bacterium]
MNEHDAAPPRATFVTVLSWVFIVLAGFATVISILQNIMITLMFSVGEISQTLNNSEVQGEMPAFANFIFSNIRLFFFGFLVVSCTTFISSIGLLKRKNWGRIIFIVIMSLGIVYNIFALVLQQFMIPSISEMAGPYDSHFGTMMTIMRVFTFLMAVGISILFAWIIKKLVSPTIRREFVLEEGSP